MDPRRGTEFLLRELLAPSVDHTYEQLRRAARDADLLVTHPVTFAGPLLAEVTRMPWVSTVLAPASLMSEHDPFVMPPAPWLKQFERISRWPSVMLMRLAHRLTRPWMAPIDALRARLGLPRGRHPVFEGQHSPTLVLALFSRVLADPQVDWPPNVRITGHIFYDGSHRGPMASQIARFLDNGEPPVVFTLGSSAVMAAGRFYEESVEAARRLERRAVLLAGADLAPRLAASLPDGMLAVDQAPHSLVMPRAAAVVQQCGIGTLGQGLRAGRPLLAVPFAHDQPDNAWRATRLGVSRTIRAQRYNSRSAAREISRLLDDPAYVERALVVSEQVRAEDGAARACEAIEAVLTRV
jgi:UDP:flavonoid glycosyltransferase YjiC (YdhE family)